jgi:hypothetical protein
VESSVALNTTGKEHNAALVILGITWGGQGGEFSSLTPPIFFLPKIVFYGYRVEEKANKKMGGKGHMCVCVYIYILRTASASHSFTIIIRFTIEWKLTDGKEAQIYHEGL